MNFSLSRQNLYILIVSVFLLIFVLLFSFLLLIPEGKEYRKNRMEVKKEYAKLKVHRDFNQETLDRLKELQGDNRHVISSFSKPFDIERFKKLHGKFFSSLDIFKMQKDDERDDFSVYKIETRSKINSPKSFYDFLDAVNKSEWIIGINFPIHFKRDNESISSSFTMKVYNDKKVVLAK